MGLNQVLNVTEKIVQPFNKSGSRLLAKEVGVEFHNGQNIFHHVRLPEGAVSGSFVQGERQFGKEGFSIVSFFDKKGRLIDRRRFKIVDGQTQKESHSIYTNIVVNGGQYNGKYAVFNKLFRRTTFDYDKCVNENWNIFIEDLHKKTPKITRAITTYNPFEGGMYTEPVFRAVPESGTMKRKANRFTFCLEEFGKGIKYKLFKSKVDYSDNGYFYTFPKPIEASGLTEQEIAQLCADRYLPLKIHSGINRYEFLKKDVFENTGIHPDFPIHFEKSTGYGCRDGAYSPTKDRFVFTIGANERITIPFSKTLATIAHEGRHKYQYDLIRALGREKLTEKEEELAKKYIKDFQDNEFNQLIGKYKYSEDKMEIDAFAWEKEYRQRFYQDEAPIQTIFNKSGISWLMV